jgi:hypothetical protein
MHKLIWTLVGGLALACSVADDVDAPTTGEEESVGSTAEAISSTCTADTIGLPCDPDGPIGPLQECQGACKIATTGLPACVSFNVVSLNGRPCGSTNGVGNAACQNSCQNGSCLPGVPKGAACRPTTANNPCEGQCVAVSTPSGEVGQCLPLVPTPTTPCTYGRDDCKFLGCNTANVTQCVTENLTGGTLCDDGNECTISDKCSNVGVCVAGAPKVCNDNNVCTNDACTPSSGACIHTPNTAPCSDNNACTTGDTCAAAKCVSGGPTDCDDNNSCTTDTCAGATGCAHAQKNCSDNDACTTDSCNPTNGVCGHATITCDDNDVCTTDSCNGASGCVFTQIPNCGDSGVGGTGGTGGAGGTAGASTGGTAGTSTGGAAGTSTGGTAGTSTGGAAGASTGGTAGTSTGGTAGTSTGGTGGSTGGSGGSTGGSGGTGGLTGGSGGSGGSTGGSGGSKADAGVGGKKPTSVETEDDGGCGCKVAPRRVPLESGLLLVVGALAFLRRRRH